MKRYESNWRVVTSFAIYSKVCYQLPQKSPEKIERSISPTTTYKFWTAYKFIQGLFNDFHENFASNSLVLCQHNSAEDSTLIVQPAEFDIWIILGKSLSCSYLILVDVQLDGLERFHIIWNLSDSIS